MHVRQRRLRALVPAVGALAMLTFASCSSDDDSSKDTTTTEATTTTESSAESAATIRFDKEIQQELIDVGCHPGDVDGVIGPETDAAILAFQEAAGITADGELGPQTEEALSKAVDEGETVCGSTTTTTAGGTTTTTAASGGEAPCTATAVTAGLPSGSTLSSYVCSDGYAAGTMEPGDEKFILQSEDGKWTQMAQDPCGTASAGLPPVILEDGCAA